MPADSHCDADSNPIARLDMLGAALDLLDEGVAVLDPASKVIHWNDAAAELTGYRRMNLLSRPCPANLYSVHDTHGQGGSAAVPPSATDYSGPVYSGQIYLQKSISTLVAGPSEPQDRAKASLVLMRHHLGHTFPAMLRKLPLRDPFGRQIGGALLFRAVEDVDALPHGDSSEGQGLSRGQTEVEDRLEIAFHEWKAFRVPFGVLWITVDQAAPMRRTHGRDACEAMLRIVEHTLAQSLRPSEVIGRWGNDEFLVLSHERTPEMLLEHASHLAGVARTAEFRWWGDRLSLTASIGAAQAVEGDTLARLLLEAQQAMHASIYAGGNHVTHGNSRMAVGKV